MTRFEFVRLILDDIGISRDRFSVEWISAAEGIRFAKVITEFIDRIRGLGALGNDDGMNKYGADYTLRAAVNALNERTMRMSFAKQAKQIKDENSYGSLPAGEKLIDIFSKEKTMHEALLHLQEKDLSAADLAERLHISEEKAVSLVDMLRKKNLWKGKLCGGPS